MIRDLTRWRARLFGTPLLIAEAQIPPLIDGFLAVLERRGALPTVAATLAHVTDALEPPEPFALASEPTAPDERPRGYRIERSVALLPVHGVLLRRAGQLDRAASTEFQSYENLGRVLRAAQRDSRVRGILLDIDSPGGEAGGVFDFADQIRSVGRTKPVWAMANDDAMSAAYVIASAAERVYATQTAALGSLGVVAVHEDRSAHDQHEGMRYTYVYRGQRKVDANPHAPLSAEAQATIQSEVDRLYEKLIGQVARQRNLEPGRLRAQEAGIYYGDAAMTHRLADRIGTLGEAHDALAQHVAVHPAGRTTAMTELTPTVEAQPNPIALPEAPDNVVQLHVDQARTAAQKLAADVLKLCQAHAKGAAWGSELAAQLIAEGASLDRAATRILERQAQASAATPLVSIDPGAPIGSAHMPRNLQREFAEAIAARTAEIEGRNRL